MNITITKFEKKDAESFAWLNYEWMNEYSLLGNEKEEMLENPQGLIIEKSGHIFLAKDGQMIVGTIALLKLNEKAFELVKLTVSKSYRGYGIGVKLLNAAILCSRRLNAEVLFLESSTKLKVAIGLYKKSGFIEVEKNSLNQCDLKMMLKLN